MQDVGLKLVDLTSELSGKNLKFQHQENEPFTLPAHSIQFNLCPFHLNYIGV
jgi:hypothetical protein